MRLAVLLAVLLLWPDPAAAGPSKSYRTWAKGPVRWLMLGEEERSFRKLRDDHEAAAFVQAFWRRRDPQPETPENPFFDRFQRRVTAADRLYTEGRRRGSLTDRGRALVLLGSPPRLKVGQQVTPALSPRPSGRRPQFAVETVRVEIWEYESDSLWPALAALLARDAEPEMRLTFVTGDDEARLVEGERLLDLAAIASVRPGGDVPPVPVPVPESSAGSPAGG